MAIKETQLKISGMTCGHCVNTVSSELKSLDGMMNVDVNLASGIAQIRFDDARVSIEQIRQAVDETGAYHVTEVIEHV